MADSHLATYIYSFPGPVLLIIKGMLTADPAEILPTKAGIIMTFWANMNQNNPQR